MPKEHHLIVTSSELYDIVRAVVYATSPTLCYVAACQIIGKLPKGNHELRERLWQIVGREWYANIARHNNCHEDGDPFYRIDQHGSTDPKDWEVLEVEEGMAQH